MSASVKDNLLQYTEVQDLFAKRAAVSASPKGKNNTVTVRKVPKKPKASSLLLKSEMEFVDQTLSPIFTALESTDKDGWYNAVIEHGFKAIKSRISANADLRLALLQRFAGLTTKRLQEIRELNESLKTKRKRDITSAEVRSAISKRINPDSRLADEVITLDPKFISVLRDFRKVREDDALDYSTSRQALINLIASKDLYGSLTNERNFSNLTNAEAEFLNQKYEENKNNLLGFIINMLLVPSNGASAVGISELEYEDLIKAYKKYADNRELKHKDRFLHARGVIEVLSKNKPDLAKRIRPTLN
jgi:hypothetical protein